MFLNTLRTRVIGKQPADVVEWNIRCLYLEIFFAAFQGAIVGTYSSLFAVRLGASAALLGVLTSAPALVIAITSIPSARYLESKTHRKAWLFNTLMVIRVGYLGIALLPILAPQNAALWLVIWVIVLTIPNAFFSNGFNALLGELVPERRRAFVFSRRTIISSLTTVAVLAITGSWLDHSAFPMNYQWMYVAGVLLVMGSQLFLYRLVVPDSVVIKPTKGHAPTERAPLTRPMIKLLFNTFVYQLGLQISGPLFILYYVNTLHASDGMISVNSAAGTLGVVFGLLLWEGVMRKRSFGWALRTATLFTWIFPFTVGFTHDFTLIIIANFVVNLVHPGVDLSSINVLLKLSKPEQRNMFLSYYTTVVNISAFVAPLAAVPLSAQIGIPGVMLVAAALRFVGGLLFQINRVPEPTTQAAAPEPVAA